jgi:formylglycine-generating enzyme required for sulfatase activity
VPNRCGTPPHHSERSSLLTIAGAITTSDTPVVGIGRHVDADDTSANNFKREWTLRHRNIAGKWIMQRRLAFLLIVIGAGIASAIDFAGPLAAQDAPGQRRYDLAPRPPATSVPIAQQGGTRVPGETFRDCADCPEMVVIPDGEFDMGSNDNEYEKPVHRVGIARPFAIGRREISFAEWDLCVAAGACRHRPDDRGWGRDKQPVIDVSYDDAKVYIGWLSQVAGRTYRLPSEVEWEYAARAGSTTPHWWGREVGTGRANCSTCTAQPVRQTVPVGSFRPNAFGLYDTAGNAAEWVEDCWNDNYRGAPKDAAAWSTGQCRQRVLRGGSFGSTPAAIRSAARFRYDKDVRYYANGFRVARDLP